MFAKKTRKAYKNLLKAVEKLAKQFEINCIKLFKILQEFAKAFKNLALNLQKN
jgi:hypothetical protein